MGDLFLGDSVGNFFVQSTGWADDSDAGIGVKGMEDAPRGDLR